MNVQIQGHFPLRPLADLVRVATGQVDPRVEPHASALHVGPENMLKGGGIDRSSLKPARESDLISGKYAFDPDALLYSKIRPNLNKAARATFSGVCSADVYPLWIREGAPTTRDFLYQVMTHHAFVSLATSRSFRTGIPKINRDDLLEIRIPLPPLPEQRKIAEILRTWDDAIELSERLRQQLASRRSWLRIAVLTGKNRLPGHTSTWQNARLKEWLNEHKVRSSGSEEVFSVSVHKGLVNQVEHLGRSYASADTSRYNKVQPGDIVYTKSPTGNFPLGIIKQSTVKHDVIVSPLYGVYQPKTGSVGTLLDALFESPKFVENYLTPLVQKGAKNTIAITNTRFLEGEICLPVDFAEQNALAQLIRDSAHQLATLERQIDLLRTQKRGLMQKLLSGETRVNTEGIE